VPVSQRARAPRTAASARQAQLLAAGAQLLRSRFVRGLAHDRRSERARELRATRPAPHERDRTIGVSASTTAGSRIGFPAAPFEITSDCCASKLAESNASDPGPASPLITRPRWNIEIFEEVQKSLQIEM
jgi:hypothetical protein